MNIPPKNEEIIAVIAVDAFRPLIAESLALHKINSVEFFDEAQSVPADIPVIAVFNKKDQNALNAPERDIFYSPLRMGALLDRIIKYAAQDTPPRHRSALIIGSYCFKPDEGILVSGRDSGSGDQDSLSVRLTEKERDILLMLYKGHGEIITHRALLKEVWGYAEGLETHTLETHIYRLRRKIENDPAHPVFLLTEETGYRLATQKL